MSGHLSRIGLEQGGDFGWIFQGGIQPGLLLLGGEDNRHAVVDGGHEVVGLGGDDGAGMDDLVLRRGPLLPETGHGEGTLIGQADVGRRLFFALFFPLVEAAGWDQAAAMLEGGSVRRLVGDGLGPGVDHAAADLRILGPEGDQAPAERLQVALAVLEDYGYRLGGGDVVAGWKFDGDFVYGELLGDLLGAVVEGEASAHDSAPISWGGMVGNFSFLYIL